jgi:hypothetical protein
VVHNSFIESAMEQKKPREIIECLCLGDSPLGCRTWSMSRRIAEHAKEALELAVDTAVFAALADFAMSPGMVPPVMLHAEEHSGTAYGAIVLHVSPEAALGGPLALVRNGDRIRLDALTAPSTCSSTMPNSAGAAPGSSFPSRPRRGWRHRVAGPTETSWPTEPPHGVAQAA